MALDSRHARYFVSLASELHFGRAAASLGISQSALSAHVSRLEDIVGGRLLDRGKRAAVRLTPLGEIFLAEATKAVNLLDRAERIGRSAARGNAGPARLSYVLSAALSGILSQAIEVVQQALPLIELAAFPLETPTQLRGIAEGRIDAGFLRPQQRYPEGVSARIVHREPLLIGIASDHPLAAANAIDIAKLGRESFIVPQAANSMGLTALVEDVAAAGGFALPNCLDASDFITAACMVAARRGIVLAPQSLARLSIEGISYLPIAGFDGAVEMALAWRGPESPLVTAILAALRV